MLALILRTVGRNLGLTMSFFVGAWLCRLALAWVGRDVSVITP